MFQRELTVATCRRRSGVVQDVVVDERRGMDHLDDGRQHDVLVADAAGRLRREQQQHRPQPLAAKPSRVREDVGQVGIRGRQFAIVCPLGGGQCGTNQRFDPGQDRWLFNHMLHGTSYLSTARGVQLRD